jgi:hypothetical protein
MMEMIRKWLLTCAVPSTADGDKQWPSGDKTYRSAYATAHVLYQGCVVVWTQIGFGIVNELIGLVGGEPISAPDGVGAFQRHGR